jgi:hypothetical protein
MQKWFFLLGSLLTPLYFQTWFCTMSRSFHGNLDFSESVFFRLFSYILSINMKNYFPYILLPHPHKPWFYEKLHRPKSSIKIQTSLVQWFLRIFLHYNTYKMVTPTVIPPDPVRPRFSKKKIMLYYVRKIQSNFQLLWLSGSCYEILIKFFLCKRM